MNKEFYFNSATLRLTAVGCTLSLAVVAFLFFFEGRIAVRWQLLLQTFSVLAEVLALQWATFYAWPVIRVSRNGIWLWRGGLRKGKNYSSCSICFRGEKIIQVTLHAAGGQTTGLSMLLLGQADWRRFHLAAQEMGVLVSIDATKGTGA